LGSLMESKAKKTDVIKDEFLLIAHRGGLFYRPENTLAAFQHQLELGIRWVECDLRLGRDGAPVLVHDDRLMVPGSGYRQVREMSLKQLQQYDAGGGEGVPTLRRLFEKFGNSLFFDLELKELDAVEPVVKLISEFKVASRLFLTSFIPEVLQQLREIAGELPRGLLIDRISGVLVDGNSAVHTAGLLGCRYLLPEFHILNRDWIASAHAAGIGIIPWTVNRLRDAERLKEMGVDGLISDKPDQFAEVGKLES